MRTQDGMRKANKEGCWTGTPPFGYSNTRSADGKSTLRPNEKAEIVNQAFQIFSQGLFSMEEVRKGLKKKGMTLTKNGFAAMLKNVAYLGMVKVKARGKEDEEVVMGLHPAIVSEEIFNKVQRMLCSKKKVHTEKKISEEYPLRNFLLCPVCGKTLTAGAPTGRGGKKYPRYNCQSKCTFKSIPTDIAHLNFLNYLRSFEISEEASDLYLRILEDVIKGHEGDTKKEIDQVEDDVKKIKEKLDNVTDLLVDGNIDQSTFNHTKKRYEEKLMDLMATLTEKKVLDKSLKNKLRFGLPLLNYLAERYNDANVSIKRKIIGAIFPNKLIIFEEGYRTTKPNSLLALICLTINDLKVAKKKSGRHFDDPTSKAPPLGYK